MAITSEMRAVSGFNEFVLSGYGDVLLEQSLDESASESLVIEADTEIVPKITSEVRHGRLYLAYDIPWHDFVYWINRLFIPNRSVIFHLTMKNIEGCSISGSGSLEAGSIRTEKCQIKVSGSGKVHITDIEAQALKTSISGSANVALGGIVDRHTIHISGSGQILAEELTTQKTSLSISGAGVAGLNVQQELSVHISGSGDVKYRGQPRISQHINGAGSVKKLEG